MVYRSASCSCVRFENVAGVSLAWASVAVTMMLYEPAGVADDVETVRTEEHVGMQDAEPKLAVAPEGNPEAERVTACEVPEIRVAASVVLEDDPGATEAEVGFKDNEKSNPEAGSVYVKDTSACRMPS